MKQFPPDDEAAADFAEFDDPPPSGHRLEILSIDGRLKLDEEFLSEADDRSDAVAVAPVTQAPAEASPPPPPPPPAPIELRPKVTSLREVTGHTRSEPPPGEALSIAELIDNNTQVEWAEAVAIAEQICEAVSKHPSSSGSSGYILDPRNIAITERGDVRVLPGAPGGDPLVKQVGRILRALLEGTNAPVPLRLVASQAALELPGYATVNELADALHSFGKSPQSEAIRTAFRRSRDRRPPPSPPPPPTIVRAKPVISRVVPAIPAFTLRAPQFSVRHRLPAIVLLVLLSGLVYVLVRGLAPSGSPLADAATTRRPPVVERTLRSGTNRTASAPAPPARVSPPPRAANAPAAPRNDVAEARPSTVPRAPSPPPPVGPIAVNETPARIVAPPPPRADDAQRLYDRIVLSDPLYQLSPERATPEAVAALRDSKRVLVPSIAQRDYDRARAAFESGALDRAAVDAMRVSRMLDQLEVGDAPVGLGEATRQLLERIEIARAGEDQRIYSEADVSVTPPEALSRTLPASPPSGVSRGQIGTLEMLISRAGLVETIKLHTPLNRYHERMIVSAAKAWRFRPAMKEGRPVRYRLISSINLPES